MKWIIGIVAFFLLIFLIFNSSSRSSIITNNSPVTTTVDYADLPDENIESDQTEKDVNVDFDTSEFNRYPCTVDCSGHEAGYEWAFDKDIDNIDDCGGNSNSFIEGCQSYVEENN